MLLRIKLEINWHNQQQRESKQNGNPLKTEMEN
jgi:hypothetical protein